MNGLHLSYRRACSAPVVYRDVHLDKEWQAQFADVRHVVELGDDRDIHFFADVFAKHGRHEPEDQLRQLIRNGPQRVQQFSRALIPPINVGRTLAIAGEFKPLVQTPDNMKRLDHYAACAGDLDIIEGEFTGGCADSGFIAGAGTRLRGRSAPRRTRRRNIWWSTRGCRARRSWRWRWRG